jgi:hypothetical protein
VIGPEFEALVEKAAGDMYENARMYVDSPAWPELLDLAAKFWWRARARAALTAAGVEDLLGRVTALTEDLARAHALMAHRGEKNAVLLAEVEIISESRDSSDETTRGLMLRSRRLDAENDVLLVEVERLRGEATGKHDLAPVTTPDAVATQMRTKAARLMEKYDVPGAQVRDLITWAGYVDALAAEYRKAAESWDRQRTRITAERDDLRAEVSHLRREDVIGHYKAERDALAAKVVRLTPKCDGGCNENTGPEESCSLHGRPVAEVWAMVDKVIDQRDMLAAQVEAVRRLPGEGHGDWTLDQWEEWSNEVASIMPENWDGDESQEDLIARFVAYAAAHLDEHNEMRASLSVWLTLALDGTHDRHPSERNLLNLRDWIDDGCVGSLPEPRDKAAAPTPAHPDPDGALGGPGGLSVDEEGL